MHRAAARASKAVIDGAFTGITSFSGAATCDARRVIRPRTLWHEGRQPSAALEDGRGASHPVRFPHGCCRWPRLTCIPRRNRCHCDRVERRVVMRDGARLRRCEAVKVAAGSPLPRRRPTGSACGRRCRRCAVSSHCTAPVPCRPLARSAGAKHRPQVVSPASAAAYPRVLARDVQRRA